MSHPAWYAIHPTFWRALLSIDRKRCLVLGFERKLSFFNVIDMLSVKMTVEATLPGARLYCVIALADISLYPSKTTIESVFPLHVSAIQIAQHFLSRRTFWPWESMKKSTSVQRVLYIPFRLRLGLWCKLCP